MNPPIPNEWVENKVGHILYPLSGCTKWINSSLNFVTLFFQIFFIHCTLIFVEMELVSATNYSSTIGTYGRKLFKQVVILDTLPNE